MGYIQEKYEQSDFNLGEYLLFLVVLICFMYYTCLVTPPGLEDDKILRHPRRHRSSDAWCMVRKKTRHRQQPSFPVALSEIPISAARDNSHASSYSDVGAVSTITNSKTSQYVKCIPRKSVTRLKMSEREFLFEDEYFDGTAKDISDDNSFEADFGTNVFIYYFIQLV